MFKHILLPTDGSLASEISIQQGIRLAKEINARVTGVHIIPEYHVMVDLIAMASHSSTGARTLLMGSQTLKVSTHSKMPVLVFR